MLLGLAGERASKGASVSAILIYPTLFATGMSLVDTIDGILMVGAYQLAFVNPIRKLHNNLTITGTGTSTRVAILIGSIETAGLVARQLNLTGELRTLTDRAAASLYVMGFAMVGVLAAAWGASYLLYRLKKHAATSATDL